MLEELKRTFKGKRIFLTGHTGFKGSWLLKTLHLLDSEVTGYALAPQNNNDLYNLIEGDKICKSIIGDLRDRELLKKSIIACQPDFVFHLAAQPLVRLSYEIPAETFEVNAIGTANVLDSIKSLEKKSSVVLITTDKVYHNNEWDYPYRENDRLGGYDPYSASKACTELVIQSYKNSFFNANNYDVHQKGIAVGRAGNVIGGGDWSKDRLIPDIAKALSLNQQIIIRNPNSIRPWQHVLEPVVAYLQLAVKLDKEPLKFSEAYNFGPYATDALPVIDMLKLSLKSWGCNSGFKIEQSPNQRHEAGLLKLDISKSIAELDWKPRLDALKAVEITMEWYRAYNTKNKDINHFTEQQIRSFLSA